MDEQDFQDFSRATFTAGQRELSDAMRTLVAREDELVYQALSPAGDRAFLEPLLFAYFYERRPPSEIAQLAYGYVDEERRPEAFPVLTDPRGRAYLPNVGHLLTERANTPLLARVASDDELTLTDEADRPVAHRLLRPTILPGTSIELLWQTDPLLAAVFTDRDAMPVTSEIPSVGRDHLDALRRAIALIEAHEPEYAELMHAALRRIFVFQHPNVNCFASLNAHGVVCFNALDRDDEVFFVDELVHQVGHVIFSAMTTRRRDFFVVDPDLTIEQLGLRSRRGELRNVYTMLHGLYTEHMMVRCLRKLDERQVFSGRQAHELRGRLAFIARKRQIDVANLSQPGICSPLGERLVKLFCGASHRLERERPDLFRIDLRGQPYNFSYDLYVRSNPPDRNELV